MYAATRLPAANPAAVLFLCLFMKHMFAAKRTKFFYFDTFRFFLFVFSAVISDAIALGALKMNCLAHILFPTFFALPRLRPSVLLSQDNSWGSGGQVRRITELHEVLRLRSAS